MLLEELVVGMEVEKATEVVQLEQCQVEAVATAVPRVVLMEEVP